MSCNMSSNQPKKREINPLDEVPRSSTPEPAAKRPRTSRSSSMGLKSHHRAGRSCGPLPTGHTLGPGAGSVDSYPPATLSDPGLDQTAVVDPYPQATLSDPDLDQTAVVDTYPQATLPELDQSAVVDPYPQATISDPGPYRTAVMDPYPQAIQSDPDPELKTDQERMARRQGLRTRWRIHLLRRGRYQQM